jgi:hypothetical protein
MGNMLHRNRVPIRIGLTDEPTIPSHVKRDLVRQAMEGPIVDEDLIVIGQTEKFSEAHFLYTPQVAREPREVTIRDHQGPDTRDIVRTVLIPKPWSKISDTDTRDKKHR